MDPYRNTANDPPPYFTGGGSYSYGSGVSGSVSVGADMGGGFNSGAVGANHVFGSHEATSGMSGPGSDIGVPGMSSIMTSGPDTYGMGHGMIPSPYVVDDTYSMYGAEPVSTNYCMDCINARSATGQEVYCLHHTLGQNTVEYEEVRYSQDYYDISSYVDPGYASYSPGYGPGQGGQYSAREGPGVQPLYQAEQHQPLSETAVKESSLTNIR